MAKHISVTGVVQGVGFRPFVYGLAMRLGLCGWVCNTSGGVEIEVQGQKSKVESFIHSLAIEAPPLAIIDSITVQAESPDFEYSTFDIRPSTCIIIGEYQPISPDTALCPDCERELFDPNDRRYLHPFINCTNCGPRFTIIKDIPYDRPNTTMADFPLCDLCRAEYENPLDRRFHAQPVACPQCGPFVELRKAAIGKRESGVENLSNKFLITTPESQISTIEYRTSAILKTRRLLREGHIIAIKGLGGFHFACDASNLLAVEELRLRKGRVGKPFALMASDLETIKSICKVNNGERDLLTSHVKPIVLLTKKTLKVSETFRVCDAIAPNLDALQRLSSLADAFLLHNRDIHIRSDDSVVKIDHRPQTIDHIKKATVNRPSSMVFLRRSRGYAPYPIHLLFEVKPTLALGGELKNTFCLARDRYAFLSHHIGDMENAETYESFEQGIQHLSHIFRVQPEILAHDLHPNYFTTQYAKRSDNQQVGVQHHHAHIASCMADNGLDNRQLIGLSFDGTGYGTDGAIWGGEVLLASYTDFERFAHLEYLPLPGSDSAIRHPWRISVGYSQPLNI